MKAKYKFQVVQDTCLLIILLSLMGFHLWGARIHEWMGVIFFSTLVLHCVLNTHWFVRVRLGEYSPWRIMQLTINTVLLLTLFTALISGLVLSRHIFYAFIFHHPSDMVRKIHMTSVHWLQVVSAVHLGMHWKMMSSFFCSVMNIHPVSFLARRIMPGVFLLFAGYGVSVFIAQDVFAFLAGQVDFSFFAYENAYLRFYVDYAAVTVAIAWGTRVLVWALFFRKQA